MALTAGTRFGPYEIVAAIGEGGMGEVYKARDTRLDRTVALKILRHGLASEPQFRERFEREARTISALEHPHICALYDVGREGDVDFLVMQYLDGETLETRLERGPLPIDQALAIGAQIANALDRAHRQSIAHRDLKPANVMLTKPRQGAPQVHLLDFGLAKSAPAIAAASGNLPTMAAGVTAEGTILGTLQYMAPEQIEGHEADARTDIFAFGCLLYETLTARKAFTGKSQASLLGAILKDPAPRLTALQPIAPTSLDRLITTCLAKDPDQRWQSAADLEHELAWISATLSERAPDEARSTSSSRRWIERAALVALGVLAGVGLMSVIGARRTATPPQAVRLTLPVTPAESLPSPRPYRTAFALSPDGRTIAFVGRRATVNQLFVRALDRPDATLVPGTDQVNSVFFSPDGKWIGYYQQNSLRKVPVDGGPPVEICQTPQVMGASWAADDTIVFAQQSGALLRVAKAGGKPEEISTLDRANGEISHRLPMVLPDGNVLFTVVRNFFDFGTSQVALLDVKTRAHTKLLDNAMDARYVESGHLIFARNGTMFAAPFDLERRKTGPEVGILKDVMQSGNAGNLTADVGAMQVAVSSTGVLAHISGGVRPDAERTLSWIDRAGTIRELPMPVADYGAPRLSPDGKKVALDSRGSKRAIWVYDLERGSMTAIAREAAASYPIWSPDGKSLVYAAAVVGNRNLFRAAADGTGKPERLTTHEFAHWPTAWAPDGQKILFVQLGTPANRVQELTLAQLSAPPRVIVEGPGSNWAPTLTSDGKWLAYSSNPSGRDEIYVVSYPDLGNRYQVSTAGGVAPVWSRDGKELFYLLGRQVFSVDVTTTASFKASIPRLVVNLPDDLVIASPPSRAYDVSLDGKSFLIVRTRPGSAEPLVTTIQVTLNWLDELRAKAPAK
jgi:serine/threonine-protein kinase